MYVAPGGPDHSNLSSGGRIPTSAARTKTWSARATPPRIGSRVYVVVFRPIRVRTYVRVKCTAIHRTAAARCNCTEPLVGRDSSTSPVSERWRQLAHLEEVRAPLGDFDCPLRSRRCTCGRASKRQYPAADPGDLGPRFHVFAEPTEAPSLQRGPQGPTLRTLRAGRVVARSPYGPDPRPHQRRPERQPPRESADRLPELRSDLRHSLRQEEPSTAASSALPAMWHRVLAAQSHAAILLSGVRRALREEPPKRDTQAANAQGSAPHLRAASPRDRGVELCRRGPEVRRLRQRRAQMGSVVRTGGGAGASGTRTCKWVPTHASGSVTEPVAL